jgi:hypothetical protein
MLLMSCLFALAEEFGWRGSLAPVHHSLHRQSLAVFHFFLNFPEDGGFPRNTCSIRAASAIETPCSNRRTAANLNSFVNCLRDNPITQFSVQWILSLNYLSQFWGPLQLHDNLNSGSLSLPLATPNLANLVAAGMEDTEYPDSRHQAVE